MLLHKKIKNEILKGQMLSFKNSIKLILIFLVYYVKIIEIVKNSKKRR